MNESQKLHGVIQQDMIANLVIQWEVLSMTEALKLYGKILSGSLTFGCGVLRHVALVYGR